MRKLLFLPGSLDSSFVVNELSVMKKYFDEIFIVVFGKETLNSKNVVEQYDLNCRFVSCRHIRITDVVALLRWLKKPYVRDEIKNNINLSLQGAKRFAYILYYGIYNILVEKTLKKELFSKDDEVFLYAFWLSRAAFCIANLKEMNNGTNKAIARAHGYDLYEERSHVRYLPFRSYIASNLSEISFISDDGKRYFEQYKKVFNIGARLKVTRLGTYNESAYVKKIEEKKIIVIASCSSVIEIKRLDLIVDIIEYLQHKGVPVIWIHLGAGTLFESIKKKAEERLIRDSYKMFGSISNKEVLKTYIDNDIDFFINMSDYEGVPVSIMEAMSVGIPVIARDVGGNREIVNEKNGLLLPKAGNGIEMYEAVVNVVMKRVAALEEYICLSNNAVKTWQKNYSAENNYVKFFMEMIKIDETE